ncbi:hypothetical protein GDO81_001783 [Engystomops pustulosus]|uniref:Ig-like domain-containing protein n=1 Tax=Engystomops pustulosus TaxID=76066 RepID=A0AAV7DFI6_ENGPU|nr:hypothetical protein GDO81_001783 [Engystomops pustulosus]
MKQPDVFPLIQCNPNLQSETISIGCLATGYIPTPVKIQWTAGTTTTASREMTVQSSGLFSTSSFVSVSPSRLKDEPLTCIVEHEQSKFKVNKEIRVKTSKHEDDVGQGGYGTVYLFCPHIREAEETGNNNQLSLVCMVKSFIKDDTKISWIGGHKDKSDITEFTATSNIKVSILTIKKEKWESGSTYTCTSSAGSVTLKKKNCANCTNGS